jgi:drug/metabolite transporter (DMT)-like permease
MMRNPRRTFAATLPSVLAVLASAVFFGLNAIASKALYAPPQVFDPVSLFVARGVWSLPLFLLLALATRPRPMPHLSWAHVGLFLLCGIAYGPGTNALSALGAGATSASHAVLLLSLFPPLASLLAALFLRERLSRLRIAGIGVGVIGAATLTLSKSGAGSSLAGDALIGAVLLTWAVLTLGVRVLDRSYPPLFVVGAFGTIGSLLLGAIGLALGCADAVLIPIVHGEPRTILWFDLELVLFLSRGGQLLQGFALRSLNIATVVALTSYGSIFAGLLASALALGERLSSGEILAAAFLVAALGLALFGGSLRHPSRAAG